MSTLINVWSACVNNNLIPVTNKSDEPLVGPRASKSLSLQAFEIIRKDILEGRLLPGSRLHTVSLAEHLGVSRAAVREALARLSSEGLAQAYDQKGFRVTPVSASDLQDLTRVRIEIETLVLKSSIENGDAAWQAEIVSAFNALHVATPGNPHHLTHHMADWSGVHQRFHLALVAACDSPRLLAMRHALIEQSERYRKLSVMYNHGERNLNDEHKLLMEVMLDRDLAAATALIARHFNKTTRILLDISADGSDFLSGPLSP
jgi:GntR family carbon starvation induced transcriptional regulator